MKLIVAIIQEKDEKRLSQAFLDNDIRATKLSSTGGFLRAGNATFLIGIEDDAVEAVLDVIRKSSQTREQFVSTSGNLDIGMDLTSAMQVKVKVGGAIVFVLPVDSFYKF